MHRGKPSKLFKLLVIIALVLGVRAISLADSIGSIQGTAVRVTGDTVLVEGESRRSADVYEALRGVTMLEQVKLAAPLRQERLAAGDATVEHFSFQARVRTVQRGSPGAAR